MCVGEGGRSGKVEIGKKRSGMDRRVRMIETEVDEKKMERVGESSEN